MAAAATTTGATRTKNLLVIECQGYLNWYDIFANTTILDGTTRINVEQAEFEDISLINYHDSGCMVTLRRARAPLPNTTQNEQRTFKVDFVLLRSVTWGISGQDSRNVLFGLLHANLPSVNSLQSALFCLERTVVFGALRGIRDRLGHDAFPLIDQSYYRSHREIVVTPSFPLVAKVGHAHAGNGKVKLKTTEELEDFRSLCALHSDMITLEPFVDYDFDMRIQKIGNVYRGFSRTANTWKANVALSKQISDMEVTPRYKRMVDECAKLFGGLDILGLDLLHDRATGQDYILELNDTAIGLVHKYEKEDMIAMRDVVVARMEQHWGPKAGAAAAASGDAAAATAAAAATDGASATTATTAAAPAAEPLEEQIVRLTDEVAQLKAQVARLQQSATAAATPDKSGKDAKDGDGEKKKKKLVGF